MTDTCTEPSRITLSLFFLPTPFLRQCLSKQLRFGSGWSCTYGNPRLPPPLHIRTIKHSCRSSFSLFLLNLLFCSEPLTPTPLPFPPSLSSDPMEDSLRKPVCSLQLPFNSTGLQNYGLQYIRSRAGRETLTPDLTQPSMTLY